MYDAQVFKTDDDRRGSKLLQINRKKKFLTLLRLGYELTPVNRTL